MGRLLLSCLQAVQYSANNRITYSFAADIWAVGILAYELLVGGPPFESPTKIETFRRILEEQPFIPSHLSAACQNFLQQVRCPAARQHACSTVLDSLQDLHHAQLQLTLLIACRHCARMLPCVLQLLACCFTNGFILKSKSGEQCKYALDSCNCGSMVHFGCVCVSEFSISSQR